MIRTTLLILVLAAALFIPVFPSAPEEAYAPAAPEAEIIFGGDMMFDRYIRQIMETVNGDYVFSCIAPTLLEADMVVANLEGPITTAASVSLGAEESTPEHYTFTFSPEVAPLLARHNIGIVNLGNNHSVNFGFAGLRETKAFLSQAGVSFFGDPESGEEERVLHAEIEGVSFSFVNWSDWTSDKTDHTVAQVAKETALGRVVVVYAHWGEEYQAPPERVKQLARSFADAGAAIVIGSHPHIVQEHERYEGVSIYYSLGNFVFDQYFSEEVKQGLLLRVSFSPEGVVSLEEVPIVLSEDGRTCLREV